VPCGWNEEKEHRTEFIKHDGPREAGKLLREQKTQTLVTFKIALSHMSLKHLCKTKEVAKYSGCLRSNDA